MGCPPRTVVILLCFFGMFDYYLLFRGGEGQIVCGEGGQYSVGKRVTFAVVFSRSEGRVVDCASMVLGPTTSWPSFFQPMHLFSSSTFICFWRSGCSCCYLCTARVHVSCDCRFPCVTFPSVPCCRSFFSTWVLFLLLWEAIAARRVAGKTKRSRILCGSTRQP